MQTPEPFDMSKDYSEGHRVYIKDGYVELECLPNYQVALSRVRTQAALLGWIHHLCGKGRMTPTSIKNFIETVSREQNIKINYDA
jgi:hypothetical protein